MTQCSKAYDLALAHIREMEGYVPGDQPQDSGWVKLNTNENPYPPSPMVAKAISAELNNLSLYPNPESMPLRNTIAERYDLNVDQIIVGNGSDDILNLLVRTFCGKNELAGTIIPNYTLYPVLAGIQGGSFFTIPYNREFSLPIEIIAESAANIFFLSSPNTPTGVAHTSKDIADLLERFSGILVVDEAYADFAEETMVGLVKQYRNLVITRSLSKSFSLAGLRVGFAFAAPEIINLLDRVRDSYNVNRLSQAGAMAALKDESYYKETIANVIKTREFCAQELKNRAWFFFPSQANFIFTEPVHGEKKIGPEVAQSLYEFLYARKILVRLLSSSPLTAGFIRISIGDEKQMEILFETIDSWQKIA